MAEYESSWCGENARLGKIRIFSLIDCLQTRSSDQIK